ncbi:MAG: rod shape-determining protein RodA [Desulfovibrio sp.]|nr:rod shape-determining protein RodA [Desulfovibrio sp.]
MEKKPLVTYINWGLVFFALALFLVGEMNLYSASGARLGTGSTLSNFYQKQAVWGLCGLASMLAVMSFDYRKLKAVAWPFYIVTLVLLLLVPLIGTTVYGAKRWISLGAMSIQPSELAKISVFLLGARLLAKDGEPLGWKGFAGAAAMGLVPVAFILKQPDLGTAIMIVLILGCMILFHGIKGSIFKICVLAVPAVLYVMWNFGMHDYQRQRILTFLDPSADPLGSGYHILQSRIAIGSGQLWGKGFTEGTQSQLRFLPERHSDFAVAVFGEEWGFVGCTCLVTLFCFFLLSIFTTVAQAKDRFGSLLCAGVFFYFFWEIFINMGMVVGIMPVVGIPLPFISYGGSATIVNFIFIGIVLNVAMRRSLTNFDYD